MAVYTSEITSSDIQSDNPIHQRLLFAYYVAKKYIKGNVLEVGCGTGRGLDTLLHNSTHYTAIDKNEKLIKEYTKKYPKSTFFYENVPPFSNIITNSVDTLIAFQVIEHIKNDDLFISEIHRVLKIGGRAIITTPNKKLRIARNPWHEREYTVDELKDLVKRYFYSFEIKGIVGKEKPQRYYQNNKKIVDKLMRWDFLNLQYLLPSFILKKIYDSLNRRSRIKLMDSDTELLNSIDYNDFMLNDDTIKSFDHFCILEKK